MTIHKKTQLTQSLIVCFSTATCLLERKPVTVFYYLLKSHCKTQDRGEISQLFERAKTIRKPTRHIIVQSQQ